MWERRLDQLLKAVILGVVQGLTEWFPISSTGHLKVCEKLLGLSLPMLFEVVFHVGTLMVVLVFFRNDVKALLKALACLDFKSEYGRLMPLVFVGTVPTAVIGWLFYEFLEKAFQDFSIIALAFIVCGVILYLAKVGREKIGDIGFKEAFLVGIAQGLAVIPGLSRSGLTIAVSLLIGVKREKAFKFSFLLSIPAVVGALALTLYREFDALFASSFGFVEVVVGAITALFVGYSALKLLWKTVSKGKFHLFAFYCWGVGFFLLLALLHSVL
ncbi:MAG: undecaprenyl-diphosphate phosphatase [Candidatus Bathyarchaeota archaeon]|nr:undecaprenyl-diphosphate phosphatase [Candidatus Bathyarchaeota archaeon]MDW8041131.1 undecaprenyl-diphosphate phosphatase [Nitrososphaerota archaeon]